jgi:hypothetical protein
MQLISKKLYNKNMSLSMKKMFIGELDEKPNHTNISKS